MEPIVLILVIFSMIAVLGILILGLATMMKGGEWSKKYGEKLMIARVLMQGVCLICLAALWFITSK